MKTTITICQFGEGASSITLQKVVDLPFVPVFGMTLMQSCGNGSYVSHHLDREQGIVHTEIFYYEAEGVMGITINYSAHPWMDMAYLRSWLKSHQRAGYEVISNSIEGLEA